MWYVWATELPQKLQLSTLCVEKKEIKSAVNVSWWSAAYPESPTSTEKLMWNHLLYAMCLPRFALFFNLFFCLLLVYTLVINTLAHTQGGAPHYEKNQLDPLSPVLVFSVVFASPTAAFWTSNQEPLSLFDTPLLIPHSQRAFFNTQCTILPMCLFCAWEQKE